MIMELLTIAFLFFSIAYIVLYLLDWVGALVEYYRLTPTQRRYSGIQVSVPEMLGFVLAVCYNVAYWMK